MRVEGIELIEKNQRKIPTYGIGFENNYINLGGKAILKLDYM